MNKQGAAPMTEIVEKSTKALSYPELTEAIK
jgi:hypothetical protein